MSTTLVFEFLGMDISAGEVMKRLGDIADDSGGKVRRLGDSTDESGKKASSASTMFTGLASGWAMLVPIAIPLGAAVLNLSGVLGLVPAAAAFAGASLLTLKLGFSGITEAIGLFNTAQDAAAANTNQAAAQRIAAANAAISADNAVKAARVSLADAVRNADNAMISADEAVANAKQALSNAQQAAALNNVLAVQSEQRAEESLTNAQNAATRAQQSLTDARSAAARSLEDVRNRVIDAGLAQRAAVEQLEKAQQALTAPITSPTQAPKDVEALTLAVDQAQQQVSKMDLEYKRATEDAAKAADKGIEGSTQVRSAQDGVTSALAAQRQAQVSLQDAQAKVVQTQQAGLQAVDNATQRLGDTTRAQQQAAVNGAEQVAKANLAVDAALRAQQQTLAQNAAAADSAVGSLHAYNAALAEMSPNAANVVRAIVGLRESWQELGRAVSQRMFAGVADDIRSLAATYLPILQSGLVGIAGGFNTAFQGITQWLSSKDTVAEFRQIFADFGITAQNLGASLHPILQIFGDLLSVGASFLPGMSSSFTSAAQAVADFVRNARDTGQLKQWIQTGLDTLGQLWAIFKDLVGIAKDLFGGASSGGAGFLSTLKDITGSVRWMLDSFPALGPIIAIALGVAGVIGFANAIGLVRGITIAWGIAQGIVNVAMWLGLGPFALIIAAAIALGAAVYEVIKHWSAISGFFANLWGGVKDIFWEVIHGIEGFGNALWDTGRNLVIGLWNGLVSWAGELWNRIVGWLQDIWKGIKGFFGISSPSTLMAEAGQNIAAGLAGGINTHGVLAVDAATSLARRVGGALTGISGSASLGVNGSAVSLAPGALAPGSGGARQGPQQLDLHLHINADDNAASQFAVAMLQKVIRGAGGLTAALAPVP